MQQDRVRAQFIGEATRVIAKHLNTLNESHGGAYLSSMSEDDSHSQSQDSTSGSNSSSSPSTGVVAATMELPLGAAAQEIEVMIKRYEILVQELLQRQQMEISTTFSLDCLTSTSVLFGQGVPSTARRQPHVVFRHSDCWGKARSFVGTVQLLVNSVIAQFRKEQDEHKHTNGEEMVVEEEQSTEHDTPR